MEDLNHPNSNTMKEEELEAAPAALEMTHADAEAIVLANEAEDQHRNKFKRIYVSLARGDLYIRLPRT